MIFLLNYYLILMITYDGMILLKIQCPALPGMIKTFLEFGHGQVTMLLVKVKGLECAGSKSCCVWSRLKCFEIHLCVLDGHGLDVCCHCSSQHLRLNSGNT